MAALRCEHVTYIDGVDIPYCKFHGAYCYLDYPDIRLCKELYGEELSETNADEDDFIKDEDGSEEIDEVE